MTLSLCFVSAQVHRSPGAGSGRYAAELDGARRDHFGHSRRHHPVREANLRGYAGGKHEIRDFKRTLLDRALPGV